MIGEYKMENRDCDAIIQLTARVDRLEIKQDVLQTKIDEFKDRIEEINKQNITNMKYIISTLLGVSGTLVLVVIDIIRN